MEGLRNSELLILKYTFALFREASYSAASENRFCQQVSKVPIRVKSDLKPNFLT